MSEPRALSWQFDDAQAFHWIRPDYGLARAAELLKVGGTIALVWTADRSEGTAFWKATEPIYQTYNPVDSSPKPPQRSRFFEEIATVIRRMGDEVVREYETFALLARKGESA